MTFSRDRFKRKLIIDKGCLCLLFDTTDGVYAHGLNDLSSQTKVDCSGGIIELMERKRSMLQRSRMAI